MPKQIKRLACMVGLFLFFKWGTVMFNADDVVFAYMAITTYWLIELREVK